MHTTHVRALALVVVGSLVGAQTVRADIYRWDTGELIPGTEGIEPGPGVQLRDWNTEDHNLRYADFAGLDLSNARFEISLRNHARLGR